MENHPVQPVSDFVFRFDLGDVREEPVYEDPARELVRSVLAALLDVVALTSGGSETRVDGFRFHNEPDRICGIYPESK